MAEPFENELTITASSKEANKQLKALKKELIGSGKPFSFNSVYPKPAELVQEVGNMND